MTVKLDFALGTTEELVKHTEMTTKERITLCVCERECACVCVHVCMHMKNFDT